MGMYEYMWTLIPIVYFIFSNMSVLEFYQYFNVKTITDFVLF